MSETVYNLIWADDQIDELLELYEERLSENGFNLLATATTGEELRSLLETHNGKVDAVIVDANFGETEGEILEDDIYGFDNARLLFSVIYKRTIPFFLFTGRSDELLNEKLARNRTFMEDFPRNERWFHKDWEEFPQMLEKIKDAVTEKQTPSFIVRNKYRKELEAARQFSPDNETLLLDSLINEYTGNTETLEKSFNSLRLVFEGIKKDLEKEGYLPPQIPLNALPRFFRNRTYQGIELVDPIMHDTLIQSMEYFIKICQDASHNTNELKLKALNYVTLRGNCNLYRSVLFIVLDLLLWGKELKESGPDPHTIWRKRDIETEGTVHAVMMGDKIIYQVNEMYELENNDQLSNGVKVQIFKSSGHKHPYDKVTKYVWKSDYILIQ